MTETPGSAKGQIEIKRIFRRPADGDTAVRLELVCGDDNMNVKIDGGKNPRFLKFVVDHSDAIPVEARAKQADAE